MSCSVWWADFCCACLPVAPAMKCQDKTPYALPIYKCNAIMYIISGFVIIVVINYFHANDESMLRSFAFGHRTRNILRNSLFFISSRVNEKYNSYWKAAWWICNMPNKYRLHLAIGAIVNPGHDDVNECNHASVIFSFRGVECPIVRYNAISLLRRFKVCRITFMRFTLHWIK